VSSTFEGDLIRPLGLVILYCGHAEREVDNLLAALSNLESFDNAKRRWTVDQKLVTSHNSTSALRVAERICSAKADFSVCADAILPTNR